MINKQFIVVNEFLIVIYYVCIIKMLFIINNTIINYINLMIIIKYK